VKPASLVLLTEMKFHADVRWHNFANIILCLAHLWYLYYFHEGKIGHFNDLFFYNARTISHLIAQRESHKSFSYHLRFNHTDLESWLFVMFWNAYQCFTLWILNDLVIKNIKCLILSRVLWRVWWREIRLLFI